MVDTVAKIEGQVMVDGWFNWWLIGGTTPLVLIGG